MAQLDQFIELNGVERGGADIYSTPAQKALRDMFVNEYLIDYDAVAAAQRCGFERQFAREFATKFMDEAYVQQRINAIKFADMDPQAETKYNQARVKAALMFEAHYRGPGSSHAARVAALSKLAALNGLENPKKIEATVKHMGGVMAVPGIAKLDEWEQAASDSQDALIKHASQ